MSCYDPSLLSPCGLALCARLLPIRGLGTRAPSPSLLLPSTLDRPSDLNEIFKTRVLEAEIAEILPSVHAQVALMISMKFFPESSSSNLSTTTTSTHHRQPELPSLQKRCLRLSLSSERLIVRFNRDLDTWIWPYIRYHLTLHPRLHLHWRLAFQSYATLPGGSILKLTLS